MRGHDEIPLVGARRRTLLALLVMHAPHGVGSDQLADELWAGRPPSTARTALQMQVRALRRALGPELPLLTVPGGYALDAGRTDTDVATFQRGVAVGTAALRCDDPERAARELAGALGLWRGPALAEFADTQFLRVEAARLEELRLGALEAHVDAELELGRHGMLVGELRRLIVEHPYRERLRGQLLLALYRSGRQAEALEEYRRARECLVEELGLEPGDELQRLQQAILAHDPALRLTIPTARSTVPHGDARRPLPLPVNRTVGRAREVTMLAARLRDRRRRLITLLGPGGVGKTRLALEAARTAESAFADGAYLVPLASVERAQDVPAAIAMALSIVALEGESLERATQRFLSNRDVLLVLDNCEHVLEFAPFVADLLASCAHLTVLATSREPLAIQAEERHLVSPLVVSEPGASSGDDAVALFVERARARVPELDVASDDAAAIADICRRVDGLPLAIELAAARCGVLSPREIATRLDAALSTPGVSARDAPTRHRTMQATIDWSYDLLDEVEAAAFTRLAVFAGGATVAAAEAVTGTDLDTLDRLCAKSLIVRTTPRRGATRVTMLHLIRAAAAVLLASTGDAEAVRERHLHYFLALVELHGSEQALWGRRREEHLARLDAEIQNVYAALTWALEQGDVERALTLCVATGPYWLIRNRQAEAVDWIDRTLALPGSDAHPALLIRAWCTKSWALWPLGRGSEQSSVMTQLEDATQLRDTSLATEILITRARHEIREGNHKLAKLLADDAFDRAMRAGDDWHMAMALYAKAMTAETASDLRIKVEAAASALERVGNLYQLARLLGDATYHALLHGSDGDAVGFARRAVPLTRDLKDPYLWALLQGNLGLAALLTEDLDEARRAFRTQLRLCRDLVIRPLVSEALTGLAALAALRDQLGLAARLYGGGSAHRYGDADDSVDARLRSTIFEPSRDRYGADAWDAAAGEATRLGLEEAIAYGLAQSSPFESPEMRVATT